MKEPFEDIKKETDNKIKSIPTTLAGYGINAPNAADYSCKNTAYVIVAATLCVVGAALFTVYKVCANGLCEMSCNNLVFVSMFVLGFAAFVIFGLLKLLARMHKQANDLYNKNLEMYDSYRKIMLERKIKEEDKLMKMKEEEQKKKEKVEK